MPPTTAAAAPLDRKKLILSSLAGAGAVIVLLVVIGRMLFFTAATASEVSRVRVAVDSETGEVIEQFHISEGMSYPWTNPKTGKATLYPPESCYWTKDGKAKLDPTYVVLNELTGKPGKTICPDCGREVRVHNPLPPAQLLQAAKAAKK